jgi:Domain of unknown function (DUF4386)
MAMPKAETIEKVQFFNDQKWKRLYWVSGILLILNAVLSLVAAYASRILYTGGYHDPESYLQLVSQNQQLGYLTWSLWIVIDILPLPIIVAMYIILQRYNRTLALLGSLVALFYAIYDVASTELNSLTLVSLSHGYALATTEAVKASFVTAATYGYHALPFQTVISFALGPIGYLLWCVPMAKSFFGRWNAIIAIILSVMGLLGAAAPVFPTSAFLYWNAFLCVRLIAIWTIILGVMLYRYGRRLPANVNNTVVMEQK